LQSALRHHAVPALTELFYERPQLALDGLDISAEPLCEPCVVVGQ
jgi:hypothetical protein